ncbi:MAG TPA: S-formylglutathione hydrolase [Alphaproteobacteria bacterium]|nr:S-formylglutathione hydrolase [Alphaproteobacteria bacterium]
MAGIETRSEHRCHGGRMGFYAHASAATGCTMRFAVFVPPQAAQGPVPALYYLAGLTCTEETFAIKAGAQRWAAEHGLMLVAPDTSPRGLGLPGEDEDWDFGTGAGFYLDAAAAPWSGGYRMQSYVNEELPALIEAHFPARPDRRGIFGHSMGGHGALVTALRNRGRWHSVSAFAPIANPMAVPWGEKAFGRYLGPDRSAWAEWDASALLRRGPLPQPILVDQGLEDQFLASQLRPEALEAAAAESGQALVLRRHAGYDHSYWFVQSFMADHIAHHAGQLSGLS